MIKCLATGKVDINHGKLDSAIDGKFEEIEMVSKVEKEKYQFVEVDAIEILMEDNAESLEEI